MTREQALGIYCEFLLTTSNSDSFSLSPEFIEARGILRDFDEGFESNLGTLVYNCPNPKKNVFVIVNNKE